MTTVVMLLVCFSSVVRADEANDENTVAGMAKTIAALTAALEAKQMDHKHVQLTTGGEVVEMVRAADVLQNIKALEKQVEACARRIDAQDAEIARELDANMAKFAAQKAQVSELSATVAQLTAPSQTRPVPIEAAETAAARRLQEAGSPRSWWWEAGSPQPPTAPPPSPPPPLPPAWPPLPATANELRISGRHTAISFNTNVDGIKPFRCVGVGGGKLTCDGALHATGFVTLEGESVAEQGADIARLKLFVGM